MRGFVALLFIGLFVLFWILKVIGKGLKAGKAALDGDLTAFVDALGSEDSKRIRVAARYLKAKLMVPGTRMEDTWRTDANAHRQLGYAYAWSTLLWHQLPADRRLEKSKSLLSALFGPYIDYWQLTGALLDAGSSSFVDGAEEGMADYLKFVENQP